MGSLPQLLNLETIAKAAKDTSECGWLCSNNILYLETETGIHVIFSCHAILFFQLFKPFKNVKTDHPKTGGRPKMTCNREPPNADPDVYGKVTHQAVPSTICTGSQAPSTTA